MKETFKAVKITENVFWVGAVDWNLRDFHGYATTRGTTYNAFLVKGEKTALIDTVKFPFRDEMFDRISSIIEPQKIDYIISNHAELDHTGALPDTIKLCKPKKVLASKQGVDALNNHFREELNLSIAAEDEELSLGNLTLSFMESRMLHWPDSMFTYLKEEKILFSQDAFGMHLASIERFDDELFDFMLVDEAAKYYANILLPFSAMVKKQLLKLEGAGYDLNMIAPDHGPVWRKDPAKIIELYQRWAENTPTKKAIVVYDTMWGSTAKLALAVAEGLKDGGMVPVIMPLNACHRSDIATQILEAGALLVGSPTINGFMFPTVADVLTYLRGLKRANLVGGAFGSHGWSNKAVGQIEEILTDMKVELAGEGIKVKYVPGEDDLKQSYDLGRMTAQKVLEKIGNP